MSVKIHGKEYTTVAERIANFKDEKPDWSITSEILQNGDYVIVKATICDESGRVVSTGHAEEVRGSTKINQTSALENCETSAWGRALAACNYGGEQVASANEVSQAVIQQHVQEAIKRLVDHNNTMKRHFHTIADIKDRIADGDHESVAELFQSLSNEDRQSLNVAPTRGGWLTVDEKAFLTSNEYAQARTALAQNKTEDK